MATGRVACTYLQNSGLGNTVNPLLSLCDPKVYQLPVLLLIGWRGEPGVKDEPQHVAQGALSGPILDSMQCPYQVLPTEPEAADRVLSEACSYMTANNAPYAILVRKDTFSDYKLQQKSTAPEYEMTREDAIKNILDALDPTDVIVSTTGMTSREVFEHRAAVDGKHHRDFLTVGCMGHASSIAQAIALQKPQRQVFCLDGDGAVIMHMGSLTTAGQLQQHALLQNFKHIVINNGAHDSVGGQPTAGFDVSLTGVAEASGYRTVIPKVSTRGGVVDAVQRMRAAQGPAMVEVLVRTGARKDLGRPTTTPVQNKEAFMQFLAE
mmetsp:Transcript_70646/g.118376  ORF Transcript_70646/g.118376 Transcript_70646/m.118376 type:complete len:322 (-) Transcript_70646:185-1150(-)